MEIVSAPEKYVAIKSDFKTDQERVLEGIKVSDINKTVGLIYQDIIDKNRDFYGFKSFKISDEYPDDRTIFKKNINNTGMIQTTFHINNADIVNRCILMDFSNNKAFSLDDLITRIDSKGEPTKPKVLYRSDILRTSVYLIADGLEPGIVVWNDGEIQKKAIDLRFGKNMGNLMSYLGLFHEIGHMYQLTVNDFGDKFTSLADIKIGIKKDKDGKEMVGGRQKIKEIERNAWAFSFAVAKKLKDQGLDLMRGFDVKKVTKAADITLGSYDLSLMRVSGEGISNRSRAKERKKIVFKK